MALFSLEQYEEAAAAFEAYRGDGRAMMLTATYAQLGQQKEMQAARREWYELVEKMFGMLPTISVILPFYPWAKPEDRERLADALRKAGEPE